MVAGLATKWCRPLPQLVSVNHSEAPVAVNIQVPTDM